MPSKRARGSYAKLICLHCRSRKIKCNLPDEATIQPSNTPQPPGKKCERCRQRALDCIVDHTTLGRPAYKRSRVEVILTADSLDDFPQPTGEASSADVERFLLSTPPQGDVPGCQTQKPSNSEMVDALSNQFRHLRSLVSRDKGFANILPGYSPTPMRKSILELVNPALSGLLDRHLVWHRLYYPYIPEIPLLRNRCASAGHVDIKPSILLFAVLCSIALDVPVQPLASYRHLQPALKNAIFHYGQEILFDVPTDADALLALELIAEYQPLALVSSRNAAPLAIKGTLYISLARRIALKLNLDTAASSLRELVDTRNNTDLQQVLMNTLQWCNTSMLEADQETSFRSPPHSIYPSPSIEFALETLKLALDRGYMPNKAYFLFHRLSSSAQLMQQNTAAAKNWKRIDKLADIIIDHEARCAEEREEVATALQTLFSSPSDQNNSSNHHAQQQQAFAISQLCETEIHARHTDIVGSCMFYAIMSSAQQQQQQDDALDPAEALRIGDHIITRLREYGSADPNRPPATLFLEKFGKGRMEELERTLTNFITSCAPDNRLDGVPFVGPTRRVASEILFRCKNVVENNAVRLKGWGGLHDRVDTQLVLLLECARRLEGMEVGAEEGERAVAWGSLCAASARLMRSLHRIVSGWRRSLVEGQRQKMARPTPAAATETTSSAFNAAVKVGDEGNGGGVSGDGSALEAEAIVGFDDFLEGDLFADWSNWPQMEGVDFTTVFNDEFSWGFV